MERRQGEEKGERQGGVPALASTSTGSTGSYQRCQERLNRLLPVLPVLPQPVAELHWHVGPHLHLLLSMGGEARLLYSRGSGTRKPFLGIPRVNTVLDEVFLAAHQVTQA